VPEVKSKRDTTNVDNDFLSEMPAETPMDNANLALLKLHNADKEFEDFSYTGEGLAKDQIHKTIHEVDSDEEN